MAKNKTSIDPLFRLVRSEHKEAMKNLVHYERKKHDSFWRILMEGRPWDSNRQQGMCLNYLLTIPLQRRMGKKQMYQKDSFPDKHRCC